MCWGVCRNHALWCMRWNRCGILRFFWCSYNPQISDHLLTLTAYWEVGAEVPQTAVENAGCWYTPDALNHSRRIVLWELGRGIERVRKAKSEKKCLGINRSFLEDSLENFYTILISNKKKRQDKLLEEKYLNRYLVVVLVVVYIITGNL